MRFPGFTADAGLASRFRFQAEVHVLGLRRSGSVEMAIPGASEQAYIDCLADCRTSGGQNCAQQCSGTHSSSSGSSSHTSPFPICNPPFVACGSSCADLGFDSLNCGACGNSCGPGMSCCGGQCAPCCYNGGSGLKSLCTDGSTTCCPPYAPFCWSLFGYKGCSLIPW